MLNSQTRTTRAEPLACFARAPPHNIELERDCAALRKAYAEASGGRVGTVADMIAAIHRGAR